MLYGNETWPVKYENKVRLERNYARMTRWIGNVTHEDRIYAENLGLD